MSRPFPFLSALVLDDDSRAVETIRRALTLAGIVRIRHEVTVEAALEAAREAPDLIVTEVVLQGGSTFPFLERIRALASRAPIVAVSGTATRSEVFGLPGFGVSAFLEKPLEVDSVVEAVRWMADNDDNANDRGGSIAMAAERVSADNDGTSTLTRAETEVLACALRRMTYREMAEQRGVSTNTIKTQVRAMLGKVGAANMRAIAPRTTSHPGRARR